MAKAKVLFVYPNERGISVIPPAIAILSKLLKDDGHQTDLFDTTFYDFEDDISLKNADKNLENTLQVRPVEETDSKKIQKKKTNPSLDLREKIKSCQMQCYFYLRMYFTQFLRENKGSLLPTYC